MKFCEIFTKITLELTQNSQKPLFKCKKLLLNTTKYDLCLFLHKMCCKMVWKFCEILKILRDLASRWAKFCEILSHSVRYGMYVNYACVCPGVIPISLPVLSTDPVNKNTCKKIAYDRAYWKLYQLDWQAITKVTFTIKARILIPQPRLHRQHR